MRSRLGGLNRGGKRYVKLQLQNSEEGLLSIIDVAVSAGINVAGGAQATHLLADAADEFLVGKVGRDVGEVRALGACGGRERLRDALKERHIIIIIERN